MVIFNDKLRLNFKISGFVKVNTFFTGKVEKLRKILEYMAEKRF
jgi:hypothetical protein